MKNDPKFQTELNDHEQKLLRFITDNSGFNELQITEKTKMNKNTVKKYLDTLCNFDLIECVELKQGEKAFFPRVIGTKSFDESHLDIKRDFGVRKSIIRKSIKSLDNSSAQEIIFVYSKCIHFIFSFDKIVKFTISSNKQKRPMKLWLELEKEIQEFVDEITTGISDVLFMFVLRDMQKSDSGILDELEYFNKSKEQKS